MRWAVREVNQLKIRRSEIGVSVLLTRRDRHMLVCHPVVLDTYLSNISPESNDDVNV